MRRLIVASLLTIIVLTSNAITITESNLSDRIDLSENFFYYKDPTQTLTFDEATSESFFKKYTQSDKSTIVHGGTQNDLWLRFEVTNKTQKHKTYYFNLENPQIDEIVFFNTIDSSFFNTGLLYPYQQRLINNKIYTFEIKLVPQQSGVFYVKLSAQAYVSCIPLTLKTPFAYNNDTYTSQVFNGLTYGLAILTALIITMLYITERRRLYISNMLLIVSVTFLLLWFDLTLYKYITPNNPGSNITMYRVLIFLVMIAFVFYSKHNLKPKHYKNPYIAPTAIVTYIGATCMLISFFTDEIKLTKTLVQTFNITVGIYLILCIIYSETKQNKHYKLIVLFLVTIYALLIYRHFFVSEDNKILLTNEHYTKVALIILSLASLREFCHKFIMSRAEYFELSQNMEDSINKRTELINKQKEELSEQREELIQQKDTLQSQREELKAQKELLQIKNAELSKISQVANLSDNMIAIYLPDGDIEWFNAAFGQRLNIDYNDYKLGNSINISELNISNKLKETLKICLIEKKPITFDAEEQIDNETTRWVQTTLTPIIHDDEVKSIIAIDADITKLKQYEKRIEQQMKDAEAQRNIALSQKEAIEAHQNEIYSSIQYAKRIQTSMMPKLKQIQRDFNDSFILFLPKDIVSGDFYWYHRIENKYFIAAVDCTGHGVPGAFLSIIGSYLLNSIVIHNGIHKPAEILKHLNRKIKISLKSSDLQDQNNDGMDIAFAVIDKEKHTLEFAGALRPMYLYNNNEFIELKGDKISITSNISGNSSLSTGYTNYERPFNPGDQFYIFSDGIIDQFGSNDGKKFLTKRFKSLLDEIKDKPMREQRELIKQSHDDWRGKYDQVDDILVIGIKYVAEDL